MDQDQQPRAFLLQDERFLSVLTALTRIKDEFVVQKLNWYTAHAKTPMLLFRVSGVLVILLSVSLPLLATLEGYWKTLILPVVALLVAGLTGLTSFFHWESGWKGYRQAQFSLEYLLTTWELQMTEASYQTDAQEGINQAFQATRQLLQATQTTISAEAEEYFKRVHIPRAQQSS
jgi:hypothetical protein